jgi:hypothetical protein
MFSSDSEPWIDSEDEYEDPHTEPSRDKGGSIASGLDGVRAPTDKQKDIKVARMPDKRGSIASDLDGVRAPTGKPKDIKAARKPRKTKKDKVQRTGWVNLNLTNTYGLASGWGGREGIRELMQNLYFLVYEFNSNNSADNVHGNPDGSERLVDWVLESTENDTVLTYIAYVRGSTPRPRAGLHQRKNCLGYIVHRKNEGRFVLVNKNTALFRHIWSMGETNKGDREHHIGGHGTFTYPKFSS